MQNIKFRKKKDIKLSNKRQWLKNIEIKQEILMHFWYRFVIIKTKKCSKAKYKNKFQSFKFYKWSIEQKKDL